MAEVRLTSSWFAAIAGREPGIWSRRSLIMTGTLNGKVALVTGGSRSIGAAIVQRLAADGAAVVPTYSASPEKGTEVVRAVEAAGGKALAVRADAGDVAATKAAVAKTGAGVRSTGHPGQQRRPVDREARG
jgi:NAD(P)-dependent dehydrogenase (short-subunit alcohol dehydrogenase family)